MVILCWSSNWWFTKLSLDYMPPLWLSAVRLFIAAVIVLVWQCVRRQLSLPCRHDLLSILAIGICQIGLYMMLNILALDFQSTDRTVMLCYATVIWTAPIAILVFKESYNLVKLLGLFFAIMGVLFYFNPLSFPWHDRLLRNGGLLAFGSTLFMAIGTLYARYGSRHTSLAALYPWHLLTAALVALIIAYFYQPHPTILWSRTLISTLSFSVIFATILAWRLFLMISQVMDSSLVSCAGLLVPVCTVMMSELFHQTISPHVVVALIMIVIGTVMTICSSQITEFVFTRKWVGNHQ